MKKKFEIEQDVGSFIIKKDCGREEGKNCRVYICQCKHCVNQTTLRSSQIRRYQSCGCLNNQSNKKSIHWKGYGDISGAFWYCVRQGAEKRGIEFIVSIEDAWEQFQKQNGKCALSGVDISFPKHRRDHDNRTASLDRINNDKGYIIGNIQWLHKKVNELKSHWSLSELLFCSITLSIFSFYDFVTKRTNHCCTI